MDVRTLVTSLGFTVPAESQQALDQIDHRLEQLKTRLEVVAGAEIIKGLFELTERFGNMGEQLESASQAAGLTAEQFQALSFAAAQNGVSQEEMSLGLARLSRTLYDARKGGKEAQKAFADAGISPEQIAGLGNARDAFLVLADSIRGMDDPIKRVAILQELMGRGSFKLTKLLRQGSGAIQGLEKDASSMGAVLQDQMVEDLAQSEDAMTGFKTVITAVIAELGARFAPNVIAVTHALERFWVRNRAIIMSKLDDWFYDLGFAIGATYAALEILGNKVSDFIRKYPGFIGGLGTATKYVLALSAASSGVNFVLEKSVLALGALKNILQLILTPWRVLVAVVGVMQGALATLLLRVGVLTVEAFPAFGEAVFTLGTALAALPTTTVAAGIVAVGTAIYTALELWNGKSFKDTMLGRSLQWVLDTVLAISRGLGGLFPRFFAGLANNFGGNQGMATTDAMQGYSALQSQASSPVSTMTSVVNKYAPAALTGPTPVAPTTNMSVEINVNGAQAPSDVAQQISRALAAQHDEINRRNMSHIQTALVH